MPPFNLSCQVRIRCFHICGEWAVVVQLDCWGQLLCTAATLKPSWSSHASSSWSSPDLPSRCRWLLSALVVLQEFMVQKDRPLALHLDWTLAAGTATHLPKPATVPSFITGMEEATVLHGQCACVSSSLHPCLFQERCQRYPDTCSCSQMSFDL